MAPTPPSLLLLRTFLKPTSLPRCPQRTQVRNTNWMPREKFATITGLDKLHRRQRAARRREKLSSEERAKSMQPPTFLASSATSPQAPSPTATEKADDPYKSDSSSTATTPRLIHRHHRPPKPNPPPHLPYLIKRTATHNLPIYESTKAGGNKHITSIRKISGDLDTLQSHMREALGLQNVVVDPRGRKKETVAVNRLTGQVVVRGWRGAEVKRWCEMVGF